MKTKSNILSAAILLAAVTAGFGQPSITTQHQTNVIGATAIFGSLPPAPNRWRASGRS